MTRVYAENIVGTEGAMTPRNIKVTNNVRIPVWPSNMPLPRWEPTWMVIDSIDRTLDYGNTRVHESGATTWEDEPSDINLAHVAAHVVQAMDAWAFSNEYTLEFVEHLEHAVTRLAMELTNLGRRMQTKEESSPGQSPQ